MKCLVLRTLIPSNTFVINAREFLHIDNIGPGYSANETGRFSIALADFDRGHVPGNLLLFLDVLSMQIAYYGYFVLFIDRVAAVEFVLSL